MFRSRFRARPVGSENVRGPVQTAARGAVSRRYEPTVTTPIYTVVTLFLAIGAINSQNNMLFVAFGAGLGLIIASGIISGPAMYNLVVSRRPPARARAGEPFEIAYTATQTGRITPAFAVRVRERPQRGPIRLSGLEAGLGYVPAGGSATASARIIPDRRGLLRLERFEADSSFPFGILRKVVVFERPAEVPVGPPNLPLRLDLLPPAPATSGLARTRGARAGQGDDLHALRAYGPGDPTRDIAWKRSAAAGLLLTRQRAAAREQRLRIELDAPAGPTEPVMWERAIALVGSVAESAAAMGWPVRVVLPGLAPIDLRGGAGAAVLVEALALIPAANDPAWAPAHTADPDLMADPVHAANPAHAPAPPVRLGVTGQRTALPALDPSTPHVWLRPGAQLPPSLMDPLNPPHAITPPGIINPSGPITPAGIIAQPGPTATPNGQHPTPQADASRTLANDGRREPGPFSAPARAMP